MFLHQCLIIWLNIRNVCWNKYYWLLVKLFKLLMTKTIENEGSRNQNISRHETLCVFIFFIHPQCSCTKHNIQPRVYRQSLKVRLFIERMLFLKIFPKYFEKCRDEYSTNCLQKVFFGQEIQTHTLILILYPRNSNCFAK